MPSKIRVEHLYKIFGKSPEEAIERLKAGASKDEILRETGNIVGLADVSFQVDTGELFVVMGLSGSGKSTLVRCINRLIMPSAGQVFIDDEDILTATEPRLRELRRTKMSMVFQHFALLPHRSVLDNVEYGLKVRGTPAEERRAKALATLDMVGLKEYAARYPDQLSGGMRQRVGLARALATDPEIMLMDEAFSALDPLIRREMQDELIHLQRNLHKTIVFITHDLNEALKLGDRIAVMKDGAIVQIGTPEEIVSGPADQYVAAFTQDVDRGRVLTVGSAMRPAEVLLQGHDSVRTAMFHMRDSDQSVLFVVDKDDKPIGMVTDKDVARAVEGRVRNLSDIMRTDFPTTTSSTLLVDVYSLCAANPCVAVVDEKGKFVGVLDQLDVLSNLTVEKEDAKPAADADTESVAEAAP